MAQIVSLATHRAARGQRATASEVGLDRAGLLSERRKHSGQASRELIDEAKPGFR
jgi:hypothetical protein